MYSPNSSPACPSRNRRTVGRLLATVALLTGLGITQAACSADEAPQSCEAINTNVDPDSPEGLLPWVDPVEYPQYDLQAVADKLGVSLQSVQDGIAGPIDCTPDGIEGKYLDQDPANGKVVTVETSLPESPTSTCLAVDALFIGEVEEVLDPNKIYQYALAICPRPPAAGPLESASLLTPAPSSEISGI